LAWSKGVATAAVVSFVARTRPEAIQTAPAAGASVNLRPVLVGLVMAAVVMGGVASWFASTHPDGLEWSIAKVTGTSEVSAAEGGVHKNLAELQKKTAFLPDYGFKAAEAGSAPAEHARARTGALAGGQRRNFRIRNRGRTDDPCAGLSRGICTQGGLDPSRAWRRGPPLGRNGALPHEPSAHIRFLFW